MKQLCDKTFILLLALLPFTGQTITASRLCAALLAVTVSCVSQSAPQSRTKTAVTIAYCALCLLLPDFTYLLPLAIYETVRIKNLPSAVFAAAAIISSFIRLGIPTLYPLLICALSAYLCLKTLKGEQLAEENRKRRDDSTELERLMRKRNRELSEILDYEVRITALNERNRIAREIHDNVGHLLSRSLLQTGALSAVCPKEQTMVKSGLEDLKDTLNSAMNSIRESVHGIRDDALDLKLEAANAVAPLKEKLNAELSYEINSELPPKIKLCFISILKEAVSNIFRHSNGDRAMIILREHPSIYQLIVTDNGNGRLKEEGMGISNMRDRAEAIGGNFSVNDKKGFTVFVSVRKNEEGSEKQKIEVKQI